MCALVDAWRAWHGTAAHCGRPHACMTHALAKLAARWRGGAPAAQQRMRCTKQAGQCAARWLGWACCWLQLAPVRRTAGHARPRPPAVHTLPEPRRRQAPCCCAQTSGHPRPWQCVSYAPLWAKGRTAAGVCEEWYAATTLQPALQSAAIPARPLVHVGHDYTGLPNSSSVSKVLANRTELHCRCTAARSGKAMPGSDRTRAALTAIQRANL